MRRNAWLVAFDAHGEVPAVERKGSSVAGVFRGGEGISSLPDYLLGLLRFTWLLHGLSIVEGAGSGAYLRKNAGFPETRCW